MPALMNRGQFPERPNGVVCDSIKSDGRHAGNVIHYDDGSFKAMPMKGSNEIFKTWDEAAHHIRDCANA